MRPSDQQWTRHGRRGHMTRLSSINQKDLKGVSLRCPAAQCPHHDLSVAFLVGEGRPAELDSFSQSHRQRSMLLPHILGHVIRRVMT